MIFFFFSSRRRHTRCSRDWSSDVCSSDLRLVARRDLEEVDPVAVAMKARRLGVDRDPWLEAGGGDEVRQCSRVGYVTIHSVSTYSGFARRSRPAAISSSALASVL